MLVSRYIALTLLSVVSSLSLLTGAAALVVIPRPHVDVEVPGLMLGCYNDTQSELY